MTEQYSTDPKYKDFNNYIMSRECVFLSQKLSVPLNLKTGVPAKRWGNPVDLSGAIIFLASSASDYISGSSIVVGGICGPVEDADADADADALYDRLMVVSWECRGLLSSQDRNVHLGCVCCGPRDASWSRRNSVRI
jgi:hypothetical protein